MKTIHLFCSLVVVAVCTLTLGGLYPPPEDSHAKTAVSKALQAPEDSKTTNIPSKPPNAPSRAHAKPSVEKKTESLASQLNDRQRLMQAAGISRADWPLAEDLVNRESGWCATKWEGEIGYCPPYHGIPDTGGYGLCQSTPASKMTSMGPGWETSPIKQLKWCHQYALTYGSWRSAMNFKNCMGRCFSPRTNNYQNKKTPWF